MAMSLIVCLYIALGSLYLLNKDYTGEKAEVSTLKNDNPSTVIVYVPKYMIHLEIPKKEWSGQDGFILQKHYELHRVVGTYLGIPMITCIACFVAILAMFACEFEFYE